tara:strand:- start:456 stop:605 length:150 start_codon:yes stop_codon:yes gene_type:complete
MRTQKHDLKLKIKHLEQALKRAVLNKDAFAQFHIYKDLDMAKSTLFNIQ